jgi:hypothetical protein
LSDLNPISVRSGANTSGKATIAATRLDERPSSTIITRLSVPVTSTAAIPTEIWNSDSRSRRPSGRSSVAASAKGRKRVPIRFQKAPVFRLSTRLIAASSSSARGASEAFRATI